MSVLTGLSDALRGREAEEFAAMLEGGRVPADHDLADLVALTRTLVPVEHSPRPEFTATLRERLVAEAATRAAAVPAPRSHSPGRTSRPRLRHAVATVTLASLVTGAGAAAASTQALPGDVLYGLKRQIENVQLAVAGSDLGRGRELLQQADARLGEAEALAASASADEPETQRALTTTLGDMERVTDAGAVALTDAYRETGDEEPMLLLDRFVTDQQERLEDLLSLLDPSLRARVQSAIDKLEQLETLTLSLLASAGAATASTTVTGDHSRDGWALSRLLSRSATPGPASGATDTELAGAGIGSTTDETRSAASDGGVLDDLADAVNGGTTSGGSSGGTSSDPLVSGGTTTIPDLGTVTAPLPTSDPLPSDLSSPLPTLEPSTVTSQLTSPLSLPTATCIPLPPLTTC